MSVARLTSHRGFSRDAIHLIFRVRPCCPWLKIPRSSVRNQLPWESPFDHSSETGTTCPPCTCWRFVARHNRPKRPVAFDRHNRGFGPQNRTALASLRPLSGRNRSAQRRGPRGSDIHPSSFILWTPPPSVSAFLRHLRHSLVRQWVTTTVLKLFASTYASRPLWTGLHKLSGIVPKNVAGRRAREPTKSASLSLPLSGQPLVKSRQSARICRNSKRFLYFYVAHGFIEIGFACAFSPISPIPLSSFSRSSACCFDRPGRAFPLGLPVSLGQLT